jgi:hypothetical protein
MTKSKIELKEYNYGTKETEKKGEVSGYDIVHSITHEQFTYLLSEYLNVGMKDVEEGRRVGTDFHNEHRTLQGSLYRFCMGAITALSKQEYFDARNEVAIRNGKKIAEMVENGELQIGWII